MGKTKEKKEKSGGAKRVLIILLIVLAVLAVSLGTIVNFITDYLWFKDLGYTSVFFKKLFTQLKIGIPAFIIIMGAAVLYLLALRKNYHKKILTKDEGQVKDKGIKPALFLSALFALLLSFTIVTTMWKEILYAANSTSFGVTDPLFGNDISFYVFKYALLNHIKEIIYQIVIGFVLLTIFYYAVLMTVSKPEVFEQSGTPANSDGGSGVYDEDFQEGQVFEESPREEYIQGPFGIRIKKSTLERMEAGSGGFQPKELNKENISGLLGFASTQIIILGVCFFLTVGAGFILSQFGLLFSNTGVAFGAGYTDTHVTLWIYRILAVLAVVAAVMFVVGFKKKKIKAVLAVPALMIAISLLGSGVGVLVQNLIVSPDELNKEYQYIENNIGATQTAYDITDIEEKPFAASNDLTGEEILNNLGTITNIRINDFEPAEQFYNQTQSIRTYYRFNDVDVDRYMIDGDYTQTFLSAREIDEEKVDNSKWLTKHIKYTHGYGITLSRVDEVTDSGQPKMIVDSIPPESDAEEINITQPEIYFGELTDDYIITNTDEAEFDYPSGASNVYTEYAGTTGVKLNLWHRILYAIQERNIKILVSTNINSNSKIIYNRNILDRIEKIAPFFAYEDDPYIVVSDEGKLYWIVDAYTTSSNYAYSTPYSEDSDLNYIRNSVKVVIDAYNGTVDYYQVDMDDPIANTIGKIYPDLLKPVTEMPADLLDNIRYPQALFDIQANIYKKYHMNDVNVFYQSEDVWDIGKEIYGQSQIEMTPNYYIMKLPGEEEEEFISSIPYTPKDKNNMTGLLIVRNDGEHYGEMILYSLSKDKTFYGPMQIESQIDQDTDISKEFSLWSSAGSTYTRGNMFVIPIEDSLMYVEPIYLEADNENSLPEVKRVIVAYGDRIAYKSTLAEALNELFGTGTQFAGGTIAPSVDVSDEAAVETAKASVQAFNSLTLDDLVVLANKAFDNAETAQKAGDWAGYGTYQNQLKTYLNQMEDLSEGSSDEETAYADDSAAEAEAETGSEDAEQ